MVSLSVESILLAGLAGWASGTIVGLVLMLFFGNRIVDWIVEKFYKD